MNALTITTKSMILDFCEYLNYDDGAIWSQQKITYVLTMVAIECTMVYHGITYHGTPWYYHGTPW